MKFWDENSTYSLIFALTIFVLLTLTYSAGYSLKKIVKNFEEISCCRLSLEIFIILSVSTAFVCILKYSFLDDLMETIKISLSMLRK